MRELRARGHDVYGCDLAHSADPKEMRADISEHRQLRRVFGDFAPIDLVYHLAAEFGRMNGTGWYEQLYKTNLTGTQNVIEECLRTGAKLIFASSSEAYGESTIYQPEAHQIREESLDQYAPAFHNEYALTKWANEKQIHIAAKNRGLDAVVLRFFNAYSEEEYTPYRSVVCIFIYRLMFGLPITVYRNYHRVFMYVGDWARTTANAAERFDQLPRRAGFSGNRPGLVPTYNVGGREYCSVEELKDKLLRLLDVQEVRRLAGSDAELVRFADGHTCEIAYLSREAANVTNKRPDISLAEQDLGHDPKTTLDEGLPLAIAWIRRRYGHALQEAQVDSTTDWMRRTYL